jgi:hypothetical protein
MEFSDEELFSFSNLATGTILRTSVPCEVPETMVYEYAV